MPTHAFLPRGSRLGLMIVALGLLAACSGSGKSSSDTGSTSTGDPTSASSSTQAPATTVKTSPATSAATCAPAPAVLAAAKKFSEVTRVSLIGGCGQLSAETTLPPGALGSPSVTRAIVVCKALSKVAYVGSVYGVSIDGKDGHELAASTKDQRQCL